MSSIKDIVNKSMDPYGDGKKRAKAACVSDHGVMFGLYDLHQECRKVGQKAITAFEAYTVNDLTERSNEGENARNHLMLLAKNKKGYQQLSHLCSVGCTDGFYYKPRIDDSLLQKVGGENIIGTSACLGGYIGQAILAGDMKKAEEKARFYKDLFSDFYLEIQPTQEPAQAEMNMGLLKLAEKLDLPMVASSDSHYTDKSDFSIHDMLLALKFNFNN